MTSGQSFVGKGLRGVSTFARHGLAGLFVSPSKARSYWRHLASATSFVPGDEVRLLVPCVIVDDLVKGTEPINLVNYRHEYGDMLLEEVVALCRLVKAKRPEKVFEIGTYLGATTLQLAANSDARVYTLDLPPGSGGEKRAESDFDAELDVYPEEPGADFRGTEYEARIDQLYGDSKTFDFSPYRGSMDFVFVDGCHHRDFVESDTSNALEMVSEGGTVVWHDYAPYAPGVVEVLEGLARQHRLHHIEGTSLVVLESARKADPR